MASPGVEVGSIGMTVFAVRRPVEVEDEFVGREVHVAVRTLDALRPGTVVP